MPNSINPQTKFIQAAKTVVAAAENSGPAVAFNSTAVNKAELDAKMGIFSGGAGSPLNGVTNGTSLGGSTPGGFGSAAQSLVSGVRGALGSAGQLAGTVSNLASDAASAVNRLTNGIASSGGLGSGIVQLAGQISAAAGQLSNILSLGRAKNLPSGAELFQQQASVQIVPNAEGDWRVRISCDFDTLFGKNIFPRLVNTAGVVFPFTPNLNITSKANYTPTDPVHSNFPFQSYKNSQVDDITISGDFPAETAADAAYWLEATTFLRSATKMFYGQGQFAGNPPVVCKLNGYGPGVFNNIPVVIKSFTIDLKDDVNYINVENEIQDQNWVPVLSTLSVTVSPIYNRERLRRFSLQGFAAGNEVGIL